VHAEVVLELARPERFAGPRDLVGEAAAELLGDPLGAESVTRSVVTNRSSKSATRGESLSPPPAWTLNPSVPSAPRAGVKARQWSLTVAQSVGHPVTTTFHLRGRKEVSRSSSRAKVRNSSRIGFVER